MTEPVAGLIDTNVLIHALATDGQTEDCRAFLRSVRAGERAFVLTIVVAYELTYALGRFRQEMGRREIADYLISIMALPNVRVDDAFLFGAIRAWAKDDRLGFTDAYLAVRAEQERLPVYTKNIRHFAAFEVEVPDPLVG